MTEKEKLELEKIAHHWRRAAGSSRNTAKSCTNKDEIEYLRAMASAFNCCALQLNSFLQRTDL